RRRARRGPEARERWRARTLPGDDGDDARLRDLVQTPWAVSVAAVRAHDGGGNLGVDELVELDALLRRAVPRAPHHGAEFATDGPSVHHVAGCRTATYADVVHAAAEEKREPDGHDREREGGVHAEFPRESQGHAVRAVRRAGEQQRRRDAGDCR